MASHTTRIINTDGRGDGSEDYVISPPLDVKMNVSTGGWKIQTRAWRWKHEGQPHRVERYQEGLHVVYDEPMQVILPLPSEGDFVTIQPFDEGMLNIYEPELVIDYQEKRLSVFYSEVATRIRDWKEHPRINVNVLDKQFMFGRDDMGFYLGGRDLSRIREIPSDPKYLAAGLYDAAQLAGQMIVADLDVVAADKAAMASNIASNIESRWTMEDSEITRLGSVNAEHAEKCRQEELAAIRKKYETSDEE